MTQDSVGKSWQVAGGASVSGTNLLLPGRFQQRFGRQGGSGKGYADKPGGYNHELPDVARKRLGCPLTRQTSGQFAKP